jgi:hypothetical protein
VSATTFNSRAEFLDIVAAGSPVTGTIRILGERSRSEGHKSDRRDESYATCHFEILRVDIRYLAGETLRRERDAMMLGDPPKN